MFQVRSEVLYCSQAQDREINPKIRDSGVSGIQMWREQKKKERQKKRRAHYEKKPSENY